MKAGERIKIRTLSGEKFWGRVVECKTHTEMLDVTLGGLCPGGPPPDPYRKFAPGRTSVTLTVELEGPR